MGWQGSWFEASAAFAPLTLRALLAVLLLPNRRTRIPVVDVEDVTLLSRLVAFRFLVLGALCFRLEPATDSDRLRLLACCQKQGQNAEEEQHEDI